MKRILQMRKNVKEKREEVKEFMELPFDVLNIDAKLQLIQQLIPLGLMHVQEVLEEEVRQLAGERYRRNGIPGCDRWGKQWGSVYIADQKIPIPYPRIRDTRKKKEIRLKTYEALQKPRELDESLLQKDSIRNKLKETTNPLAR